MENPIKNWWFGGYKYHYFRKPPFGEPDCVGLTPIRRFWKEPVSTGVDPCWFVHWTDISGWKREGLPGTTFSRKPWKMRQQHTKVTNSGSPHIACGNEQRFSALFASWNPCDHHQFWSTGFRIPDHSWSSQKVFFPIYFSDGIVNNYSYLHLYGCFQKLGIPQNGWFIVENPIKMDDLGGTIFFWKHPYLGRLKFSP